MGIPREATPPKELPRRTKATQSGTCIVRYSEEDINKQGDVTDDQLHPNQILRRLMEDDVDVLAGRAHGAATTSTLHDAVVATASTVAGATVEQIVISSLLARGDVVLALEDTLVHVGSALGALGADGVAVHVDVTGDIESAPLAEGNLPPGLVPATEQSELGVGEGGSAGSRDVGREGKSDALARLDSDGDLGLVDVDRHTGEAIGLPAVEDGILVVVVGELSSPVAVVADPDATVVALVVLANLATDAVGQRLNATHQVGDNIADLVTE